MMDSNYMKLNARGLSYGTIPTLDQGADKNDKKSVKIFGP
jgi:hypothetical protein